MNKTKRYKDLAAQKPLAAQHQEGVVYPPPSPYKLPPPGLFISLPNLFAPAEILFTSPLSLFASKENLLVSPPDLFTSTESHLMSPSRLFTSAASLKISPPSLFISTASFKISPPELNYAAGSFTVSPSDLYNTATHHKVSLQIVFNSAISLTSTASQNLKWNYKLINQKSGSEDVVMNNLICITKHHTISFEELGWGGLFTEVT